MKYSAMYKRLACVVVVLLAAQPLTISAAEPAPRSITGDIIQVTSSIVLSPFKALTGQMKAEASHYARQPITCIILCASAAAFASWSYSKFVKWLWGRRTTVQTQSTTVVKKEGV